MIFEVTKRADNSRYANCNEIRLVNLAPIGLFSNYNLTTSSRNHLEDISHAHTVSLRYKRLTSSKISDDLSVDFDRSRNRSRDELTNKRNVKVKYHPKLLLKDVSRFAEHQEKATYGLGYKLTLTRNKNDSVIDKATGVADARIHLYVPQYTPSSQQQGILSEQILDKRHLELRYVERSVLMKDVNNQILWYFELASQESMNVPIWIIIGFQQ